MRLIPFHLHPTFSRLARTVVLALCLFDTIVAAQPALPTGQEPDQPEIIVDNLRLLRWQRADDDTKGERILCLDFETLIEQICSPFSSAKQWNQIQTVELGKAYFLNPTYVEETLGHLRKALAKCRLWEGDPEQEIWKCFDGLVDILSKSISGLRMPYHYIVSDATMEIWHGYNLQPCCEFFAMKQDVNRRRETSKYKSMATIWSSPSLKPDPKNQVQV
ncbi:hypothetical protein FB446DRAFT_142577 [Lentinula raphanica]|nr:hypothetical protein FB446DRAFT_142577 [Lentinula raphanica]